MFKAQKALNERMSLIRCHCLSLIVKRVRIVTVALNLVFGFNIELFTRN